MIKFSRNQTIGALILFCLILLLTLVRFGLS